MIRLDSTTKILQLIATDLADVIVSGSVKNATNYTGFSESTAATASTQTIAAAAAASTVRDIDHISIVNKGAANTLSVQIFNSSGSVTTLVVKAVLATGDVLEYTHAGGWRVLNSSGSIKTSVVSEDLTGAITSTGSATILGSFTKAQLDTAVSDSNIAYSGGAFHNGFSDYVPDEHLPSSTFATSAQGTNADTAFAWGNHTVPGYLTSFTETNDLSAAVVWSNIPIANVPTGTTGTTVALGNHNHAGVYEPVDATILKDADIGVNVQAYDAKFAHISVTQAVNLDTIESRVNELDAAVVLVGPWDASVGTFPTSIRSGQSWIISVEGTVDGIEFKVDDRIIALVGSASTTVYAANWLKLDYTDKVATVAGRTGSVVISKADIADFGSYATPAQGSLADTALQAGDIDTLAELNVIVGDATLIDTTDSRLSNARTPTAHNQAWSTITSTPTTMAGYGISDTKVNLNAALSDGSFMYTGDAPTSHAHQGTEILSTGESGASKFLREDGDGTSSWQEITGGGDALVANPLSQFAATTLAQLNGVMSDATLGDSGDFATAAQGGTADTALQSIASDSISMDMLADIATDTFLGRVTASTGTVEVLSNTQAKTALDLSGTNSGDQTITLTGDVTSSGTSSLVTTIADAAVSLAKMDDVATASVFYRKTSGTGAPEVNTLATLKTDLAVPAPTTDLLKLDGSRAMTGNLDINGNEITDASVIRGLSSAIYVANNDIFGDTGMAAYAFGTTQLLSRSAVVQEYDPSEKTWVLLSHDLTEVKVGINKLVPTEALDVVGNILASGTSTAKAHISDFCDLGISTSQDIGGTVGLVTYINWNGTELHKDATFTHSTSTNTSRVTVNATGRYHVKATVNWDNTGANRVTLRTVYRINGGAGQWRFSQSKYSRGSIFGNVQSSDHNFEVELTDGDYIEVGSQVSDTDATYVVDTVPTQCSFIMRRIG